MQIYTAAAGDATDVKKKSLSKHGAVYDHVLDDLGSGIANLNPFGQNEMKLSLVNKKQFSRIEAAEMKLLYHAQIEYNPWAVIRTCIACITDQPPK